MHATTSSRSLQRGPEVVRAPGAVRLSQRAHDVTARAAGCQDAAPNPPGRRVGQWRQWGGSSRRRERGGRLGLAGRHCEMVLDFTKMNGQLSSDPSEWFYESKNTYVLH